MQLTTGCRYLFAYLDRMVSESLPKEYRVRKRSAPNEEELRKPSAAATASPPAADEATADASPGVDPSAEPGGFARLRSGCARSGCAGSCSGADACGPAEPSTGAAAEATTGAPAFVAEVPTRPKRAMRGRRRITISDDEDEEAEASAPTPRRANSGAAGAQPGPDLATAHDTDPDAPPRKRLRTHPDAEPAPSDDEELPDAPAADPLGLRDQMEALPAEKQCASVILECTDAKRVATVLRDHGFVVGHNRDASAALPCNQNVAVLVTGPDAIATIYYITDYMTKMGYWTAHKTSPRRAPSRSLYVGTRKSRSRTRRCSHWRGSTEKSQPKRTRTWPAKSACADP